MRNMAYAVTISKVDDIKGKDKIGLLHFKENAYTVIGSKRLKPGDVVCYFEVDSILPETPVFEFLRKRCYNDRCKGFLIRKIKIIICLAKNKYLREISSLLTMGDKLA